MRHFYKSAARLLLTTAFLLLVAWVCMKLMQGDLDLEGLMQKGERLARDLGKRLGQLNKSVLQPARRFVEPRLNELVRWAEELVKR